MLWMAVFLIMSKVFAEIACLISCTWSDDLQDMKLRQSKITTEDIILWDLENSVISGRGYSGIA